MTVYIVLECEEHEGGDVVAVFKKEWDAIRYTENNPLSHRIYYYDIQKWEVQ